MNKRSIKVFTVIGILSVVLRVAGMLCSFYITDYYALYLSLDSLGQLLFLSLFFFVIKDLRENYGKGVWPIYLFICSTILLYIVNIGSTNYSSGKIFIQLLFFVVIVIFIAYLLRTVYKLFGIAFIISIILSALLRYVASEFLSSNSYKYWIFLGAIPTLYPLVLIYIVRTKSNNTMQDEINSIGSDIEDGNHTSNL